MLTCWRDIWNCSFHSQSLTSSSRRVLLKAGNSVTQPCALTKSFSRTCISKNSKADAITMSLRSSADFRSLYQMIPRASCSIGKKSSRVKLSTTNASTRFLSVSNAATASHKAACTASAIFGWIALRFSADDRCENRRIRCRRFVPHPFAKLVCIVVNVEGDAFACIKLFNKANGKILLTELESNIDQSLSAWDAVVSYASVGTEASISEMDWGEIISSWCLLCPYLLFVPIFWALEQDGCLLSSCAFVIASGETSSGSFEMWCWQ